VEVYNGTHNGELLVATYAVHELSDRLEQQSYRFTIIISIAIVYRCPFGPLGRHNFFVVQIIRVDILKDESQGWQAYDI
jgi:hypothetical protein